jgi:hypothetical protein
MKANRAQIWGMQWLFGWQLECLIVVVVSVDGAL